MGRKQWGLKGRAFIIGADNNGAFLAKQLLADLTLNSLKILNRFYRNNLNRMPNSRNFQRLFQNHPGC